MAVLKSKIHGGFYITKGYSVRGSDGRDIGFAAYEVLPRGERFFIEAGFRDGAAIEHSLFYMLVMDEMITNSAISRIKITLDNFPVQFMERVRQIARDPNVIELLRDPSVLKCRDLLDCYSLVRVLKGDSSRSMVTTALALRLGSLLRNNR